MIKHTCPYCDKDNYSADTISKVWICAHCGRDIFVMGRLRGLEGELMSATDRGAIRQNKVI